MSEKVWVIEILPTGWRSCLCAWTHHIWNVHLFGTQRNCRRCGQQEYVK